MNGMIGRYRLHRTMCKVEGFEEHLASFDGGTGKMESCRLWVPGPDKIGEPEKMVDQLSPLLAMNHVNLTRVIDVSPSDESLYIVYEYEPQRSLVELREAHAAKGKFVPVSLGVHVIMEILQGLQYALGLGPSPVWWTHGDLTLDAIEITGTGQIRLRRLGLARALAPKVKGGGIGAVEARKRLSPASDARAAAKLLRDLIQPHKQKIPPKLARLLARAMSPDKDKKFSDAGKLLQALSSTKEEVEDEWSPERIEALLGELCGEELAAERQELADLEPLKKRHPSFVRQASQVPGYIPDRTGTVPPSGAVIDERYQVIRELGQGGVGVVLEVEHVELGTRGALKMLDPDVSRDPAQVERFKREARSASRIGHPNIVRVIDLGRTEDDRFYYVMDLIRGENLGKIIAITGALDQQRAVRIILQVCDALEAAHNHNVVHRDLKPENLMISSGPEGRDVVGVVDFGLSLTLDSKDMRLTQKGFALGTPYYMAPEQISGQSPDTRTDIYAAGAILYEMLTGQTPFEEETIAEVLTAHLRNPPQPPRLRAPSRNISPELEAVVLRALEKDPDDRFQSMAEMAQAIMQAREKYRLGLAVAPFEPDLRFVANSPAIPPPMAGGALLAGDTAPRTSPPPPASGPYANIGGTTPPVAAPPSYEDGEAQPVGVLPDPFDDKTTSPAPPPVDPPSDVPTSPAPPPEVMGDLSTGYTEYEDEEPGSERPSLFLVAAIGAILVIVLGAGVGVWFFFRVRGAQQDGVHLGVNTVDSSPITPVALPPPIAEDEAGIDEAAIPPLSDAEPAQEAGTGGDAEGATVEAETGTPERQEPRHTEAMAGPSTNELYAEAQTLLKQGRTAEAKRAFQHVVRRSPSKAAAWAGLGQAEFELGQHPAAASSLSRAVRLNPRSVRYRLLLANSLLRSGRRPEAMNEYREVLRLDPNNSVARRMLGGSADGR